MRRRYPLTGPSDKPRRLFSVLSILIAVLFSSAGFGAHNEGKKSVAEAAATIPQITALSATTVGRSGYLVVSGTGLGSAGTVNVAGLGALSASWTDTRIVVYVPEAAPLGTVPLFVQTADGTSNTVNLTVTNRQSAGRARWRFQMDGSYSFVRPAIAPDNTIYAVDVSKNLYALSPNGELKWLVRDAGNKGLAVGADGTIYTASEDDVKAYHPDGTLRWRFVQNPRAFIMLNLQIGPDGNLYGVASSGMGIFSLTPQGALRWTNPEQYSRPNVIYTEIVFSPNNGDPILYFYANAHTRAVKISNGANVNNLFGGGQPRINPLNGNVHQGTAAYAPTGALLWNFNTNGLPSGEPAPAPDGTIFMLVQSRNLYALSPDGAYRWNTLLNGTDFYGSMDVSPNNATIVVGTINTLNNTNSIVGLNAANGAEFWRVVLPPENGANQLITTGARFTSDSRTAYLHTATGGSGAVSFLYAIDLARSTVCAANCARVKNIRLMARRIPAGTRAVAYLDLATETGAPLGNASVSIRWTLPDQTTIVRTVSTAADGTAIADASGRKGNFALEVLDVERAGFTFDPVNSVTSAGIFR